MISETDADPVPFSRQERSFTMPIRLMIASISLACVAGPADAARLKLDDKASLWPRASMSDKIDFADRMGRAFHALSPQLDDKYFMKCSEETANIGDTKELRMEATVSACISLLNDDGE